MRVKMILRRGLEFLRKIGGVIVLPQIQPVERFREISGCGGICARWRFFKNGFRRPAELPVQHMADKAARGYQQAAPCFPDDAGGALPAVAPASRLGLSQARGTALSGL